MWLARSLATGEKVALKQFPRQNKALDPTAQSEVIFGRMIFPRMQGTGGKVAYGLETEYFPGIKHISKLLDEIEDSKDYWLVYEVGAQSLGKQLFDVKGEFFKGERIYHVSHASPFY